MNAKYTTQTHWSFWIISTIILFWNVLGSVNFFMQMDSDVVSSYREVEQAIIKGRPLWATLGFGFGVLGGALGCIQLLRKKESAFYFFCASLLGVVIAIGHSLTVHVDFAMGEIVGIVIMPVIVSIFLIWYVKYCQQKGWLKPGTKSIPSNTNVSAE